MTIFRTVAAPCAPCGAGDPADGAAYLPAPSAHSSKSGEEPMPGAGTDKPALASGGTPTSVNSGARPVLVSEIERRFEFLRDAEGEEDDRL